jgi:hypothetical protein
LTSFHSGIADEILLLLVFVLITGSSEYKPLRIALAIALTPLPYFMPLPLSITLSAVVTSGVGIGSSVDGAGFESSGTIRRGHLSDSSIPCALPSLPPGATRGC